MGKTKKQVLSFMKDGRAAISSVKLADLHASDVRAFADELAAGGRGPATVSSYLTHLCYVLMCAEDDFGPSFRVDESALVRGKRSARRSGPSGRPNVRERRPWLEELDEPMTYFVRRAPDPRTIPMHFIAPFAIFGIRRQGEIVKKRWADIDETDALIRNMKDPRRPDGRDRLTQLTDEAARIIQLQGKQDAERVWPYHGDVISRTFTDACKLLEIDDLHFHDLRHEGVS